ncbi:hypothetical protein J4423_00720 [Candidatus Pacearchaeota archaeon]|nr:hypothetical protein [Candidatus Pacearchaeota archaeon]
MHKEKGHEHKATSKATLEEQTIHSLVELQKVHINLAEKFDKLTTQIENLLALFELAARNFAKQPNMQNTEKDKEFLDKIDKLLDQNKLLAKGLSLMEEKMREKIYGVNPTGTRPQFRPSQQMTASSPVEEI